jgi:hypothetical protein
LDKNLSEKIIVFEIVIERIVSRQSMHENIIPKNQWLTFVFGKIIRAGTALAIEEIPTR